MRVEECKVADDDRNRKCYRQYACKSAHRADEHAEIGFRSHISVPDCRHGDDRPPQADRDGREVVGRVVLRSLRVEDKRREDDDAEDEEEDEKAEFVCGRFECVNEDLESGRMSRQFKETHDADDAEELEDVVLLLESRHEEVKVEGESRDEVDDVDRSQHEDESIVTDGETDEKFESKPGVADALDVEEGEMRLATSLVQHPRRDVIG